MLNAYPHKEQGRFCFYSRPNCSLTRRGRKNVFWGITAVALLIASVFSWLGYWLIFPFAGLEIGLLAWAFDSLGKRVGDYESLRIRGDEILLKRWQYGHLERRAFNCQWARLVVIDAGPGGRVELFLRSHGQETELGLFLTDEERLELAEKLRAWIRKA